MGRKEVNPATVATAILTRLKADTTLWDSGTSAWKAPLAGGANFVQGSPTTVVYPYLVYGVDMPNAENSFDGEGVQTTVTFQIVDGRQGTPTAPGVDRLATIIDRLIGDAMLASGTRTAPTYGFHNHKLTLPTNTLTAVASAMSWVSSSLGPGQEEHLVEATVTFTLFVSAQAVNP